MMIFRRALARYKRRKRIKNARAAKAPLREFVYLDEVSVYSLLASRQGALASEYTENQSTTSTAEIGSAVGATAGVLKGDLNSKMSSAQTRSSQVLKKSTIQSAFKELHDCEEGRLAIRPIDSKDAAPRIESWIDFQNSSTQAIFDRWVIQPSKIRRGHLMELEVEVGVHDVFKVTSIIAALGGIIEDSSGVIALPGQDKFGQAMAINRIFERLMVGLVPIECKLVEYRSVTLRGREYLIHTRLLEKLPAAECEVKDVFVVGVTEQRLYWKDLRRVLFSGARFRIMCRSNDQGLKDDWVPVKLTDLLKDLTPGLDTQIAQFGQMAFVKARSPEPSVAPADAGMVRALIAYGNLLAAHGDVLLNPDQKALLTALAQSQSEAGRDFESRKAAFSEVAKVVKEWADIEIDPVFAAQSRVDALAASGVDFDGDVAERDNVDDVLPSPEPRRVLDAEIVALYW
ncbi:DUF6414 family protein [Nonomuraea zeae]|uniref:Uncharacterized protein n=1 Tax=Nonomuraea zeae TaxID=1642303 RepID=A0A5S4H086_9ACTN|nr:hypothetical protein [Nonomuraea zeae]TMR38111.1 hypothetical protein ETD85_05610 [Nonomuraea zeae]